MPIPTPKEGEQEKDFISRCAKAIADEFPDNAQRVAVCYSKLKEKMSKEELFVLQPKKNENRGAYLSRCSKNGKMKGQFPNMKERMGYCLNSFNAYYKYWAKMEDFSEVPQDSALGLCIAKKKAQGIEYKQAYAECASKVVVPSSPIVLSENNLLIEPVEFSEVSIDFDDTLSTQRGQELAMKMIENGDNLHIITRRSPEESEEVYRVADELGIPRDQIHFTSGKLKWEMIKKTGVSKHIDNNPDEIDAIKENLPNVEAVKFSDL